MADPFPKADRRQPTGVGEVRITLQDRQMDQGPMGGPGRRMNIEITPVDENGNAMTPIQSNLARHLTPQQKTTLDALMDAMVAKAAEVVAP